MTTCVRAASSSDTAPHHPAAVRTPSPASTEYGYSFEFLRQHYSAPQRSGESNFIVDLWAEQNLSAFVRECKLTNNHALLISSHGGPASASDRHYCFYPHESLLPRGAKTPQYSAGDMAALLGPQNAASIHVILVSGCNAEGAFNASELRRRFVNATNIIHMPAGELGYQPMFRQILTARSTCIQPIFETRLKNDAGHSEFIMGAKPSPHCTRLGPYVADLFKPGAVAPFRVQTAGRELLAPSHPSLLQ